MKAKEPPYTISLYRTTNGIFPNLTTWKPTRYKIFISLEVDYPYKTDAGAKRGIIRLAKRMGLIK